MMTSAELLHSMLPFFLRTKREAIGMELLPRIRKVDISIMISNRDIGISEQKKNNKKLSSGTLSPLVIKISAT